MDWYQRQMDEIMSSLTHLPDIKIFLPDLSALADSGWMSSFGSGMKQQLGNIVGANSNQSASSLSSGISSPVSLSAGNSDLTLAQNNALNAAMQVPTNYSCLQCGEFANNYIEKLTGVENGPIRDSYESKQGLVNSSIPTAGSIAIINTGAEYGHAAVVTQVNNNGTVNLVEANYSSPGTISQRNNVPTGTIFGYHIPSSSASTSSASVSSG